MGAEITNKSEERGKKETETNGKRRQGQCQRRRKGERKGKKVLISDLRV